MSGLRFVLALQLFLFLAFLLPVLLVRGLENPEPGIEALLAWLVAAYSAARLALLALDGDKRLPSLTFFVFTYIWFGIAPLLQFLVGEFPLAGSYSTSTALASLALVLVGMLAFDAGHRMDRSVLAAPGDAERVVFRRVLAPGRTLAVVFCGTLVALVLIWRLGGLDSALATRFELTLRVRELFGDASTAQLLLFFTFLRVPVFVALYVVLLLWWHGRRGPGWLALVALLVFVNLVVNNPINSPRYWVGTIVLGLAFAFLPWSRRTSFALWAGAAVLLLLLIFPYADLFRVNRDPELQIVEKWKPLTYKADYDAFQQVMNAELYVEEHGLGLGRQIVGTLLFWVPRSLWEDKPIPSGELVAESAGYGYTNLSFPLWAEAYIDGGLGAAALVLFLYGMGISKLERVYLQAASRPADLLSILVPIFSAYQIFLLRGALMSALAYLVPIVGLIALCTVRASRAEEPAPAPEPLSWPRPQTG